jgi:hypothetical protein
MRLAARVCQLRYLLQCLHTLPVIYHWLAFARPLLLDASAVALITRRGTGSSRPAPPVVSLHHVVYMENLT